MRRQTTTPQLKSCAGDLGFILGAIAALLLGGCAATAEDHQAKVEANLQAAVESRRIADEATIELDKSKAAHVDGRKPG